MMMWLISGSHDDNNENDDKDDYGDYESNDVDHKTDLVLDEVHIVIRHRLRKVGQVAW